MKKVKKDTFHLTNRELSEFQDELNNLLKQYSKNGKQERDLCNSLIYYLSGIKDAIK